MCVLSIAAYCWSYELIPVVAQLYQTLDGLFSIAKTSLTFSLLQVSYTVCIEKMILYICPLQWHIRTFVFHAGEGFTIFPIHF